jgi:hypothetical protein
LVQLKHILSSQCCHGFVRYVKCHYQTNTPSRVLLIIVLDKFRVKIKTLTTNNYFSTILKHQFQRSSLVIFLQRTHCISSKSTCSPIYPILSYLFAQQRSRTCRSSNKPRPFRNNLRPLLPLLHRHRRGGLVCSPPDKDAR